MIEGNSIVEFIVNNTNNALKKNKKFYNGAPEEIRTPDPQIRSLVLYPAELRVHSQFSILERQGLPNRFIEELQGKLGENKKIIIFIDDIFKKGYSAFPVLVEFCVIFFL